MYRYISAVKKKIEDTVDDKAKELAGSIKGLVRRVASQYREKLKLQINQEQNILQTRKTEEVTAKELDQKIKTYRKYINEIKEKTQDTLVSQ